MTNEELIKYFESLRDENMASLENCNSYSLNYYYSGKVHAYDYVVQFLKDIEAHND